VEDIVAVKFKVNLPNKTPPNTTLKAVTPEKDEVLEALLRLRSILDKMPAGDEMPSSNAKRKPMAATWFELSSLKEGARVRFVRPWSISGCSVPAGTLATIKENSLMSDGIGISVVPDDKALQDALKESHGAIFLWAPDNLAPFDPPETKFWQSKTPLEVLP
jgi:hypothetical protein